MNNTKKLLIFDAYGTLISTGNGSVRAAEKILSLSHEYGINAVEFYAQWKKLHRRHIDESNENGFITEREIFREDLAALYELYGIHRPYEEDVKIMLASLYGRQLFSETAVVIEYLRRKYRVVIGSTTDTEPLMANLRDTGLCVDSVYTSESLGVYKPAGEFYLSILSAENCSPDEAVFIGDSLTDDVTGPKSCGITAVFVDRSGRHADIPHDEKPDYTVTSLLEIEKILCI